MPPDTATVDPPISAKTFEGSFSAVWVPTIARERERETYMSDFARPPKNRHVREKARVGKPMGFTHWSNEECTFYILLRKNGKERKLILL